MDEFVARIITHKLLVGVKIGLLLSIQGAFLVEKSLSLWQIGVLVAGTGAITTLLRPGCQRALARFSRIAVFKLSQILLLVALGLAILAQGFWPLAFAALILGGAQALATGTIAVWVLDQVEKRARMDQVQQILPIFNATLIIGMLVGAILGGYLPTLLPLPAFIGAPSADLIGVALFAVLHLALSPSLFREGDRAINRRQPEGPPVADGVQMVMLLRRPAIGALVLAAVLGGAALAALEAFWQPRLLQLAPPHGDFASLGFATAGLLSAAMAGPLTGRWLSRVLPLSDRYFLALAGLMAAMLFWFIGQQETPFLYLLFTMALFFVLSLAAPAGMGALRDETEAPSRRTAARLFVFAAVAGMFLAATLGAFLVREIGLVRAWQALAIGLAVAGLAIVASNLDPVSRTSNPPTG